MGLERYHRQTATSFIDKNAQKKFFKSRVAVVGLGGIGSGSANLLLRAGIKNLILVDRDFVDESNLLHQPLYDESDIKKAKAIAAKEKLEKIDSESKIKAFAIDLSSANIDLLEGVDLIVDGTDNFEARFLINDFSLKNKIPWVYAGAIEGRICFYAVIPYKKPCFQCIFKKMPSFGALETCETSGILNTTSSTASAMQVQEALKILSGKDYKNELICFDAWNRKLEKIHVKHDADCKACNGTYEFLDRRPAETVKLCGKDAFQITPVKKTRADFSILYKKLKKLGALKKCNSLLYLKSKKYEIYVFEDARAIIKNVDSKEEALSVYSRVIGN